jgi:hypothetical protein
VNLQGSGPYDYRPPEQYFTELAQGFSVEVGTPSLSTLESLRASIPEADSRAARSHLRLRSRIISLDDRLLAERVNALSVAANSIATLGALDLKPVLAREELVLVQLTLSDSHGATLSENLYWQGRDAASQRRLLDLRPQSIGVTARARKSCEDTRVEVVLTNQGRAPALAAKITMLDEQHARVLPVDYDDNYVSLLPGATRHTEVLCPAGSGRCARVALRGWNAEPRDIAVERTVP